MPEESDVAALQPPAWAEKYDYHWIFRHNGKATPFLWRNDEWNSPYGGLFSPIEAHCAGFVYSHPADPSARVLDPENEVMVECAARVICRTEGNAMTDHIATIRYALKFVMVEPAHDNALDAVSALNDELNAWKKAAVHGDGDAMMTPEKLTAALISLIDEAQRLRDDPNRLDPQSIPEGWTIEVVDVCLSQTIDGRKRWVDGEGPNPRAALAAAIERIGK